MPVPSPWTFPNPLDVAKRRKTFRFSFIFLATAKPKGAFTISSPCLERILPMTSWHHCLELLSPRDSLALPVFSSHPHFTLWSIKLCKPPPITTFSPHILPFTTTTQHLGHVIPEQCSRCHTSASVFLLSPSYPAKVPFLHYQLSKACQASKSNLNYPCLPSHPAGNLHQLWPLQSVY